MMTVTCKRDVPAQMVADLLVTAYEGGSNYWIESVKANKPKGTINRFVFDDEDYTVVDYPMNGGTVDFTCDCDDKTYTLTFDKLKEGMQLMADKYPHYFTEVIEEQYDANTADVYLQLCLFGELVYG